MPARTVTPLESLPGSIAKIFDQAQSTTANHQKNYVALHKLQQDAATHTELVQNGRSVKLVGERAFEDIFIDMLSRVLQVKKGASVADRIMRFIGGYTRFMNEKALEDRQQAPEEDEDEEETTASRFVARVLRYLLKGCSAKDKIVRFRVVQCIAETVSHLGEIDEELYNVLRASLLERLRDKETVVRVQAVLALSKICGADDGSESPTILEILLEALQCDPSADVRKAALISIPVSPQILPPLLSRTRDIDATVRRFVYSVVLNPDHASNGDTKNESEVGVTHPRALTIAQRELVVRHGLGDREELVKAAAAKLLAAWVDIVRFGEAKSEADKEDSDIIAFLHLFDLVENTIPEDALKSVFKSRVDILDSLEFGDSYWETMTPERAFLVRVFVEHCVSEKDEARLEAALPVVTALAFKIQDAYNNLLSRLQDEQDEDLLREGITGPEEDERRARREEERLDREFIISEMLKLAVNLDYADEIGRRKMFQLVRNMISQDALPEGLLSRCLDVLRKLSPNERDLIRVVVEVIHEIRDPSEEEEHTRDPSADGETSYAETPATVKTVRPPKATEDMSPEDKARADVMDLRCLSLCIGMLERVNGTFEENSTLEGILGELIIPAVKRKELALRERGLISLGLCCLIARRMALNSLQLFLSQVQSAPEVLKIRVLQIVFDILMVHGTEFLGPDSPHGDRIIDFMLHLLDNEESDKVQAIICVGISKLMLAGMISDERVLRSLVLVYLSPETADNQELRQCLTYFFPVYCYSSAPNQRRMQQAFVPLYQRLREVHHEWEKDDDIVSPAQASLMFVDWTDPQKAAIIAKSVPGNVVDDSIHIDLANNIIKILFEDDLDRDDKKGLCQLLGKLHIPDTIDDDKIRTLKLLMHSLRVRRPLRDTSSKNAFTKFEAMITKKFEKQLEDFNEEEYRQLENLKEMFEFLDEVIPYSDDEEDEPPKKRGGRKRRSESVMTDETSESGQSDDNRSTVSRSTAGGSRKGKAKRRRLSQSDDESDDETEKGTPTPSAAPSRVMPRRSAADKSRSATSKTLKSVREDNSDDDEEEDDDDDDDDEEEMVTPRKTSRPPEKTRRARPSAKAREQARLDEDSDDLLDGDASHDSIIDTTVEQGEDEEDDDEEVDDILG